MKVQDRTYDDLNDPVQSLVNQMIRSGKALRVLEAGAGNRSHVQVGTNAQIVGIDICQQQLDRNEHLSEKILGDIQTYPLPPSSFDIIFCWDVLEHLREPEKAMQNFVSAIREDGLIVIGSPLVNSVKGLVTKYTPGWFHVFVYRYLLGVATAGKPGHGPFPTFMSYSMTPRSLERMANDQLLSVEYLNLYEQKMQIRLKQKYWIINWVYYAMGPVVRITSFGHVDPKNTDFTIVLRKRSGLCPRSVAHSFYANKQDSTTHNCI
jgi:SAM-dependent methyltransferase